MISLLLSYGGIGEVVNTVDCGSIIRGFDSHIPSQIIITNSLRVSFFILFRKPKVFLNSFKPKVLKLTIFIYYTHSKYHSI